jgi:eukaryotic-like serine/threonine-protein kinase
LTSPLQSGDTISRYRITGPLGKGGMGVVYAAEDLRLGRRVALKFLPEERLDDTARKRFLNEARAAAQVRHPHICPVYDVEEVDGRVFLAMAHIEGETLSKRIKRDMVPLSDALRWTLELLSGLEAAHAAGIVHRDIKSSNLMLDEQGRLLILDFGLALMEDEERLTVVGQAVGTMAYMSPEQARGAAVDARTDLWSAGAVLYEMITGRLPGLSPAPLAEARPEASAELQAVVSKALAERLPERWPSAREMRLALERISTESAQWTGTRTVAVPSLPAGKKSLNPRWLAALLVVALMAAGAVAVYQLRKPEPVLIKAQESTRRIALLPLAAKGEQAQAISDGLLEVWAASLADAERGGQKIWVVPVREVLSRKLESAEETRRVFGVEQVVTGTADPEGTSIRISLRLIDTATLKSTGEQTILYNPTESAASRDRSTGQVLSLLNLQPSKSQSPPGNTNSFGAYLEGRGLLARFDKMGNVEKAIQRFESVLSQDPNFALAYVSLGEAYWQKSVNEHSPQDAAKAIAYARKGVQLQENLALGHAKLGKILAETGNQEEGLREIERALELSPGNADAYREMAAVYVNQGKFAEAETLFRNAISSRPTDWLSYTLLALFYDKQGRMDEAEAQLRLSAKYAPENAGVMRNLGRIYRMQGKYAEAVDIFQQAIRIQPSARNYNSQGLAYYYMHRYRDAINAFEASIELDDKDHLTWGNLGSASSLNAESKEKAVPALRKAIELAEKALTVTPQDYSILADLAEFHSRLGDRKSALQALKRIPASAQGPLASRMVLAYELSGERQRALEIVRSQFKTKARLREILDEPAIPQLLADPEFQRIVGR